MAHLEMHDFIFAGAATGLKEYLNQVLSQGGHSAALDVINSTDRDGRTSLIHTARLGQAGCMKVLLDHGADVHYNNPAPYGSGQNEDYINQGTAMHEAAIRGHEECVDLLLSRGSSPFVCNGSGATAFDCALNNKTPRTMISKLKNAALCSIDLKAKCCMHVGNFNYPTYKACQAVVTPFLAEGKEMKRVYLFSGPSRKARAVITYEAGEASSDGQEVSLMIRDPDGHAVRLPGEESMTSNQKLITIGGVLSYCALSVAGPPLVYASQALYTAQSDRHFMLFYDGRKCYDAPDPTQNEVAPPMHTSVYFIVPQAEQQAFMRSLKGPNNELMWQLTPDEELLYSRCGGQGPPQGAGEASASTSLKQRMHE